MAIKKIQQNLDCKSETHNKHMCYLISQGFQLSNPDEYDALVENPRFKCQHCGRVAKNKGNLCEPIGV